MKQKKYTKRALCMSLLSMLLCCSMLVGTTFAWFTDSVTSGKNKIVAGNLDVELEYATGKDVDTTGNIPDTAWQPVNAGVTLFDSGALWEPGHTEIVYLRVTNKGTLALKYKLTVTVEAETPGTDVNGATFNLSDYLVFKHDAMGTEKVTPYASREDAWEAAGDTKGLNDYSSDTEELLPGKSTYGALIVYMPTDVGNEANYRDTKPEITLGVDLFATQAEHEEDSFGPDYDADAPLPVKVKNTEELMGALEEVLAGGSASIVFEEDVDITEASEAVEVTEGKDITIDLGGNELTTGENGLTVQNGSLTITDSDGNGALNMNSDAPGEAVLNVLGSDDGETVLNFEGVEINVEEGEAGVYVDLGYMGEDGDVTINLNEGTVINLNGDSRQTAFYFVEQGSISGSATLNISDGVEINLNSGARESTAIAMSGPHMTLNMDGGEINVNSDTNVLYGVELVSAVMNMTGGTIHVSGAAPSNAIRITMSGTVNMSGGSIEVETESTGYGIYLDTWPGIKDNAQVHLSGDASITATGSNVAIHNVIQEAIDDENNPNYTDTRVKP